MIPFGELWSIGQICIEGGFKMGITSKLCNYALRYFLRKIEALADYI